MPSRSPRPVLAGIDGSAGARYALDMAAAEAALHRLPLRIVHAARRQLRGGGALLADASARAFRRYPDLAIDVHVASGPAAAVLAAESADAALTVVGGGARSAAGGLPCGSVSSHVAGRGHGAVLVARGMAHPAAGRPVVVCVDGSAAGDLAIGFAFGEAEARRAALRAVLVWSYPPARAVPGYRLPDAEWDAAVDLEAALNTWAQKYPDVRVERVLTRSRYPARALLAAAAGAGLLVVPGAGGDGVRGLPGGSVGHAAVHHARCPVVVVHADR